MENIFEPILQEVTPLQEKDCFYVIDRKKNRFSYPLHRHQEYELNFVYNAPGVRRVVGDSTETIGKFDLVLITGANLEHAWLQGECTSEDIREITIQFLPDVPWLNKNQFLSIAQMFDKARSGIAFSEEAILKVYPLIERFASGDGGFGMVLNFLQLLYELSLFKDVRPLSSTSYAHTTIFTTDTRIQKIQRYIEKNFDGDIKLGTLADIAGMSPESFSRYFHQSTGKTLSDYLLDYRIGKATRSLVDTADMISTVCYECGFNNVSYFNRMFRKRKGCTPKEFRDIYQKKRIIV